MGRIWALRGDTAHAASQRQEQCRWQRLGETGTPGHSPKGPGRDRGRGRTVRGPQEVPSILGLGAGQGRGSHRASPVRGLQDHPCDGRRRPESRRPPRAAGTEWGAGRDSILHQKSGREACEPHFAVIMAAFQLPGWSGPGDQVVLSTRCSVLPTGKTDNQNNSPSCYRPVHLKVTCKPSLGAILGKKTSHSHCGRIPHERREGNSFPPSPASFQI